MSRHLPRKLAIAGLFGIVLFGAACPPPWYFWRHEHHEERYDDRHDATRRSPRSARRSQGAARRSRGARPLREAHRALASRALSWLPVALLVAVAAAHFGLVRCCALHPWLGGGFGMFSTVDERHFRALRIDAEGEQPVELPPELEDAAERAEALPSEARLRALAGALATDPALAGGDLAGRGLGNELRCSDAAPAAPDRRRPRRSGQ